MTFPFSVPSPTTVQAQYGSVEIDGLLKTVNIHQYDATRDVVGIHKEAKPEKVTTLGVRVTLRLTAPIPAGQRLDFDVLLGVTDSDDFGADDAYAQGLVFDEDTVADEWVEYIFWFFGFYTQFQDLRLAFIRRANPWSDDLMTPALNPPDVDLLIGDIDILPRDPSDDPPTVRGYGYSYGTKYGTRL